MWYLSLSLSTYLYIYIYTYISREREREREIHVQIPHRAGKGNGRFSKFHVCFCGLDPGNLKFETVRKINNIFAFSIWDAQFEVSRFEIMKSDSKSILCLSAPPAHYLPCKRRRVKAPPFARNWKPKRIRLDTADLYPCRLLLFLCPFVTPCVDRSAGHSVRTTKSPFLVSGGINTLQDRPVSIISNREISNWASQILKASMLLIFRTVSNFKLPGSRPQKQTWHFENWP